MIKGKYTAALACGGLLAIFSATSLCKGWYDNNLPTTIPEARVGVTRDYFENAPGGYTEAKIDGDDRTFRFPLMSVHEGDSIDDLKVRKLLLSKDYKVISMKKKE